MKRNFFLISILCSIILMACDTSPKALNDSVLRTVVDSEMLVNTFDSTVQVALANNRAERIAALAEETSGILLSKIEDMKSLSPSSEGQNLKAASIAYVESLIEFVLAQKAYSNFTDSTSLEQATIMDSRSLSVIRGVEANSRSFYEYQSAFAKAKGLK